VPAHTSSPPERHLNSTERTHEYRFSWGQKYCGTLLNLIWGIADRQTPDDTTSTGKKKTKDANIKYIAGFFKATEESGE